MQQGQIDPQPAKRPAGSRIGRRIMALVAVAVLVSVSLVAGAFVWIESAKTLENRRASIEATAYIFASAVADEVEKKDRQSILEVLRAINRLPDISYVLVADPQGREIASLGSAVLLQDDTTAAAGTVSLFTANSLPVAVDIVRAGQPIAKLIVIADISALRSAAIRAFLYALLGALAASGAGMVVALRLQRTITNPIMALTRAMQKVRDTKSFVSELAPQSDDETGLLVDTFNGMIAEINTRDAALAEHRRTLEATVEQRTHELSLAKDAAESANRAKSGFLATMSHEIRTPMNGLMVMAELLAAGGLDRRQQRYAEVIVKSGQSLLTIINDILDLSKIEAGKLELERIGVDPVSVADDVVSLFWERASSKGLDLAARVAPGVPPLVNGDPVRLNQILSNLVNNALKFTEQGQVLISIGFDRGYLHYTVTDSGIGIPRDKLASLFSAFSQADQTITRKFGGTGLGLAICKRLTEAMGGTIQVASEPGRGSSFRVAIPVSAAARQPIAADSRGRVALLVDGLASRAAIGAAFAAAGYRVEIYDGKPLSAGVLVVSANRLSSVPLPEPRAARVICVSTMADTAGEQALTEGRADDLVTLPLRHADLGEVLDGLALGKLRGKSLVGARRAAQRPSRTFRGHRILVADDNAVNREVLIEVLRQLDVTVDTAVDGSEAVERWRKSKPDLIFMDCSMPVMDGFAATREIRAHEHLDVVKSHTPIVALTAHIAGGATDEWKKAGMDAYITKPFTLNTILACLEQRLAGAQAASTTTLDPVNPAEILDEAVLDEVRKIGGSDLLYRRVLEIFAAKAPSAMEALEIVSHGDDLKALADAAHALKSMCANIGARRALAACHDLEHAARTGEEFEAGEKIAAISRELLLALNEVQRRRAA